MAIRIPLVTKGISNYHQYAQAVSYGQYFIYFLCLNTTVVFKTAFKWYLCNYTPCYDYIKILQGIQYQLQLKEMTGSHSRVATFRFRLNSLCFPCVHDQFPCVFQYINIKYYFYKWPPLPFTAILSSLLFNSNIKSSAFDYKNTLPC